MKKLLLAMLAISVASATAYADTQSSEGYYLGVGVSNVKNDSDSTSWTPAEIFGGYKLNPYVGGEFRFGKSLGGSIQITNYESAYYRVESANSVGKTYLLLGYTHADVTTPTNGDFNFNGLSYGAGVGFIINDQFNLNLEYKVLANAKGTHYINKFSREEGVSVNLNSLSATVDYRF